jgi:hypothetical protein
MKSTSDSLERDLVDTVGSAFGTVWLVLPMWLGVISVAGFIPAWVADGRAEPDPTMLLAWIAELGMSAMTIVGLFPIVLHWWFLRSMLDGQGVGWNLWRSFVTQVLTGAVVLGFQGYSDDRLRLAVLGVVVALIAAGIFLVRRALWMKLEQELDIRV